MDWVPGNPVPWCFSGQLEPGNPEPQGLSSAADASFLTQLQIWRAKTPYGVVSFPWRAAGTPQSVWAQADAAHWGEFWSFVVIGTCKELLAEGRSDGFRSWAWMIFVGLFQLWIFCDSQKSGCSFTISSEGGWSCGSFLTPYQVFTTCFKHGNHKERCPVPLSCLTLPARTGFPEARQELGQG